MEIPKVPPAAPPKPANPFATTRPSVPRPPAPAAQDPAPPPPAPTMTVPEAANLLFPLRSPNDYDEAEKKVNAAFHGAAPWNLIAKHLIRRINGW